MNNTNILSTIPDIHFPSSVNELGDLNAFESNRTLIAGGTLLQVHWETGNPIPSQLTSLELLEGLRHIKTTEKGLEIGALSTLATCEKDPLLKEHASILVEACKHIASPSVRNRGTIGGNICSGKGDSIPALLSLKADLKYYNGTTFETIPLQLWLDSPNLNLKYVLTHIILPIRSSNENRISFFRKIGRREAFTAALVTVAIHCCFDGKVFKELNLCIGGGDHSAHRLKLSESFIKNKLREQKDVQELYDLIYNEVETYSDAFATADYRKRVTSNIVLAFLADNLKKKG
ncbi:FAD binding domain-containing protein [Litchfieldia salsa]|uniref:Carbon-monoxide dehydrogenase medium subunit n=1 Tax=Litchfieldia salsa TaxID=930152 RepID=A0A1H0TCC6_9BACI|nr:FAD binding domain-containing protein [Litchfieldia salsa]SDP51659.1 carbon-monoxide dehydrogenase medium subunit [Litchfieldia salsa]